MHKCINCQMDRYGPFSLLIWFKWTSMTNGNVAQRSFVYCFPYFWPALHCNVRGWFLRRKLFVWTLSARAFTLQNMEPMHQKILCKPLRLLLILHCGLFSRGIDNKVRGVYFVIASSHNSWQIDPYWVKSAGTLRLLCCVAPAVADLEAGGVPYTIFLPDPKVSVGFTTIAAFYSQLWPNKTDPNQELAHRQNFSSGCNDCRTAALQVLSKERERDAGCERFSCTRWSFCEAGSPFSGHSLKRGAS